MKRSANINLISPGALPSLGRPPIPAFIPDLDKNPEEKPGKKTITLTSSDSEGEAIIVPTQPVAKVRSSPLSPRAFAPSSPGPRASKPIQLIKAPVKPEEPETAKKPVVLSTPSASEASPKALPSVAPEVRNIPDSSSFVSLNGYVHLQTFVHNDKPFMIRLSTSQGHEVFVELDTPDKIGYRPSIETIHVAEKKGQVISKHITQEVTRIPEVPGIYGICVETQYTFWLPIRRGRGNLTSISYFNARNGVVSQRDGESLSEFHNYTITPMTKLSEVLGHPKEIGKSVREFIKDNRNSTYQLAVEDISNIDSMLDNIAEDYSSFAETQEDTMINIGEGMGELISLVGQYEKMPLEGNTLIGFQRLNRNLRYRHDLVLRAIQTCNRVSYYGKMLTEIGKVLKESVAKMEELKEESKKVL